MRRTAIAIAASTLAFFAALAGAQQQPAQPTAPQPPQTVGNTQPYGGWRGASNNPGTGTGDMPGMWAPANSAKGMPKGPYGLELAQRMHDAQKLVDEVNGGKALSPKDSGRIRNLMREDFFAWSKQYDLPQAGYRAERDRWLVDADALTPEQWAKHRLEWLEAERDWILAHGG
jgi:hypothetical protein